MDESNNKIKRYMARYIGGLLRYDPSKIRCTNLRPGCGEKAFGAVARSWCGNNAIKRDLPNK